MSTVRYESGKSKRFEIVVYNSDDMSFTHVIDAFQMVLGYDITQATNCANLVHTRGEYTVKSYSELEHAESALDMLYEYGLRADVIDKKQK
jgi:ATP-dependent Clp protease adapter protein ClpS